jgi:ribonuclease-3
MGRKDRGGRETKKPKKDAKKQVVSEVLSQPVTVQVIKTKGKKEEPFEEGQ